MKLLLSTSEDTTIKKLNKNMPANLMCFSHLRWDFVFQRPQHLLTRLAKNFNVFFMEEPMFDAKSQPYYSYSARSENVTIVVPHLMPGLDPSEVIAAQKMLFDDFIGKKDLTDYTFWYYTPMALEFTRKHTPSVIIYDCMDELSAFKFAPEEIKTLEKELMTKADLVFTGGNSLYEAKKNQHANIFPFPSSIEKEHFARARNKKLYAADQKRSQKPKLGFYGVIDERFDIELIRQIADARPEWEISLIGPIVKIDAETLPANSNIHYLGSRSYEQLPEYLATWDVALIPFLLNDSTRFISPTKTPEYLAGSKPVVSTPIRDVVNPYGKNRLVYIGSNAQEFIEAIETELQVKDKKDWLKKVDAFLATNSWDNTVDSMLKLIVKVLQTKFNSSIAQ